MSSNRKATTNSESIQAMNRSVILHPHRIGSRSLLFKHIIYIIQTSLNNTCRNTRKKAQYLCDNLLPSGYSKSSLVSSPSVIIARTAPSGMMDSSWVASDKIIILNPAIIVNCFSVILFSFPSNLSALCHFIQSCSFSSSYGI